MHINCPKELYIPVANIFRVVVEAESEGTSEPIGKVPMEPQSCVIKLVMDWTALTLQIKSV